MSDDSADVRPEDALQVPQRPLSKVNEKQQVNEELRERVIAIEAAQPDRTEYADLDRETKVGMVREPLVERTEQVGWRAVDVSGTGATKARKRGVNFRA